MLALLLACAPNPEPPAVDHIPDGTLQVRRAGVHEVSVRRAADGPFTELVLDGRVVLGGRWNPDRPAVDDDGAVAFVSGVTGVASVWLLPPGGEPVQLTNVGLEGSKRRPGQPPPGFVPPPVDDSLAFEGDGLTWNGPDGPFSAPLTRRRTPGLAHEVRR